jgi:chromosome segregation ATPase
MDSQTDAQQVRLKHANKKIRDAITGLQAAQKLLHSYKNELSLYEPALKHLTVLLSRASGDLHFLQANFPHPEQQCEEIQDMWRRSEKSVERLQIRLACASEDLAWCRTQIERYQDAVQKAEKDYNDALKHMKDVMDQNE